MTTHQYLSQQSAVMSGRNSTFASLYAAGAAYVAKQNRTRRFDDDGIGDLHALIRSWSSDAPFTVDETLTVIEGVNGQSYACLSVSLEFISGKRILFSPEKTTAINNWGIVSVSGLGYQAQLRFGPDRNWHVASWKFPCPNQAPLQRLLDEHAFFDLLLDAE